MNHITRIKPFILTAMLTLLLFLCGCGKKDGSKPEAVTAAQEDASTQEDASSQKNSSQTEASAQNSSDASTQENSSQTEASAQNSSDASTQENSSQTEASAQNSSDASTQENSSQTEAPAQNSSDADTPEDTPTQENSSRDAADMEITLSTLNIKHGAEGLDTIAAAIQEISPDIIGLEEVDVNCGRSGNIDEPAELARLAGYPYYAFSRAIYFDGGEYGTAILSHYPIESFAVIPLESGNGESRSLGHAVINVEGLSLDVFVTHLSYEDRYLRIEQMQAIAEELGKCEHYALLGDFNSFDLEDIENLGGDYYVNRPDRPYITFQRYELAIDNIVVCKDFTELSSGVSETICSDHKLLYAVFRLSTQ